jgi:hypothetical protein
MPPMRNLHELERGFRVRLAAQGLTVLSSRVDYQDLARNPPLAVDGTEYLIFHRCSRITQLSEAVGGSANIEHINIPS